MVGRQHHYNLCVVVPDHSPEVFRGVGQRMLGNNEFVTLVVTLERQKNTMNSLTVKLCRGITASETAELQLNEK